MDAQTKLFDDALKVFILQESENIKSGVSEPNLCSRLAIYLTGSLSESEFEGYFVDTEYNRKQNGEIKTIVDCEMKPIRIKCDIIIHTRRNRNLDDNLIAMEMKKSSRPQAEKRTTANLRSLLLGFVILKPDEKNF